MISLLSKSLLALLPSSELFQSSKNILASSSPNAPGVLFLLLLESSYARTVVLESPCHIIVLSFDISPSELILCLKRTSGNLRGGEGCNVGAMLLLSSL